MNAIAQRAAPSPPSKPPSLKSTLPRSADGRWTVVEAEVTRLFSPRPGEEYAGFSAGVLCTSAPNRQQVKFAGPIGPLSLGTLYQFEGTIDATEQYGEQLKVKRCQPAGSSADDIDLVGLAAYIGLHPEIKGIGPAKAKKLVADYGIGLLSAARCAPEEVCKAVGVGCTAIESIATECLDEQDEVILSIRCWLAALGLTFHEITKVVTPYGWDTRRVIEHNPYLLMKKIKGFGFRRCDSIARKAGVAEDNKNRLESGILYYLGQQLDDEGHCWTEAGALVNAANEVLILNTLDAKDKIREAINALCKDKKLAYQWHDGKCLIGLSSIYADEARLVEAFASHGHEESPLNDVICPEDVDAYKELNEGQSNAVRLSLGYKVSVITGGAGVGKTYTLRVLGEIVCGAKRTLAFAAPSGKAARRITESTNFPAQTIHRLLEYSERIRGFARDSRNPIEADMVVIDESSMVDSPLMASLLDAIDFKRTALVLAGDCNQLPPVGPGFPFRDVVQGRLCPISRLNTIVRQSGTLAKNSNLILDGIVALTADKKTEDERLAWYRLDNAVLDDASAGKSARDQYYVRSRLVEYLDGVIEERLGFDLLRDVQVLTSVNKDRALSVLALNAHIQRIVQRRYYGVELPPPVENEKATILVGDRVIQTKNNYRLGAIQRTVAQFPSDGDDHRRATKEVRASARVDVAGVMNGTLGVVRKIRGGKVYEVEFEDGQTVEVKGKDLNDLSLAYALTVHKAQGSEFPCAVVVCHKNNIGKVQHRHWLYTAVTRAKQCCILIGDTAGIKITAAKKQIDERRTYLGLRPGAEEE